MITDSYVPTGMTPVGGCFESKGRAMLFLYSPRMYGTQVLRPYTYQIDGNAVDKLVYGGDSMLKALSRKDIATSPEIAGAVMPEANGTKLDMNAVGQLWTFVLQIDLTSPWLGGSAVSRAIARRRVVYTGLCLDEPLNPLTLWNGQPTLNENCPLRFTHATETVIDPGVGATGAQSRLMVRSDVDIVDSALDQQANNEDLYIATPDKVLKNTKPESGISTEGLCALANQRKGVGIVTTLKSPLAHLRQLCMGIDQQVHMFEAATGNTVASHMSDPQDIYDVDNFKSGVTGEWGQLSTSANSSVGNIEAGDIILMGFLVRNYPDIVVIPNKINTWSPIAEQNGVVDQTKMDPKSIYSSMVAASIATLANNFGFSRIDFSYDSIVGQFDSDRQGSFEVRDAELLTPPSDPEAAKQFLAHALEMFRHQLLIDLVPALKAAKCGDFQMHVMYMINAETYVDLNFYDWQSSSNDGIYETTNRIANVNNTSIATGKQFIHNGTVLNSLVTSIYGRNMGDQFGIGKQGGQDPGGLIDTFASEGPGWGY